MTEPVFLRVEVAPGRPGPEAARNLAVAVLSVVGGADHVAVLDGPVHRLDVGHTNTIDIVAERVVVKWFDDPVKGGREVRLLDRLTRSGCSSVPRMLGAIVTGDGGDVATGEEVRAGHALVSEYLPDRRDAWAVLSEALEGSPAVEDRGSAWEPGSLVVRTAALLGEALADLHAHLMCAGTGRRSASARAEQVRRRLHCGVLADADVAALLAVVDTAAAGPDLVVQDVHADVHLGQFLMSGLPGTDAVGGVEVHVIDLEGDPIEDLGVESDGRDTRVRDVVSAQHSLALLALDGTGSEGAQPPAGRRPAGLAQHACDTLLDAYLARAPLPPVELAVWGPLLAVEKAIGEVRYAQVHLPSWEPTARRALTGRMAACLGESGWRVPT